MGFSTLEVCCTPVTRLTNHVEFRNSKLNPEFLIKQRQRSYSPLGRRLSFRELGLLEQEHRTACLSRSLWNQTHRQSTRPLNLLIVLHLFLILQQYTTQVDEAVIQEALHSENLVNPVLLRKATHFLARKSINITIQIDWQPVIIL